MSDQVVTNDKTKEEEVSAVPTALEVYTAVQDDLESLLVSSLGTVTALAFSAKLIGDALEDDAMNRGSMSQQDRALFLIREMRKTIRVAEPKDATEKMGKFLEILQKDLSQRPLADKISN